MSVNLKTFLKENRSADLKSVIALKKYIGNSPKDIRDKDAIDRVLEGFEKDDLYKSEFGEIYTYSISRQVENIYKSMFDRNREMLRAIEDVDRSAYWDIMGTNPTSLAKTYKLVMKHKNLVPQEMIDFLTDLKEIKIDIAAIKAILKSGRKPSENTNPNKFMKPMASNDAKKEVSRIVKEATASFQRQLEDSMVERYVSAYRQLRSITDVKELVLAANSNYTLRELVDRNFVLIKDEKMDGKRIKVIEHDDKSTETTAVVIAKRAAKEIIDGFEFKNIDKLSLIFQKKHSLRGYTLHKAKVSYGLVENSMSFVFDDGSKFTVYSKAETSYSGRGKPFLRYPTRFTDVFLADGTRMSTPSEEKMIKEF